MMAMLEVLKASLATIPGVASCRIGLEDNTTPDDYPLIRLVPSNMVPGIERVSGGFITRKGDLMIYFGMPLQPFDDTPDAGGRVRLEKLYKALFDLEAAIMAKLSPSPAGITALRYRETITDEDRLETYKLMALRVEIEG